MSREPGDLPLPDMPEALFDGKGWHALPLHIGDPLGGPIQGPVVLRIDIRAALFARAGMGIRMLRRLHFA